MKEKIFIGAISADFIDPRLTAEIDGKGAIICHAREPIDGGILFCSAACPIASFWSTEDDAEQFGLLIAHEMFPVKDGFINHRVLLKEITTMAITEVQFVMNLRFLWKRFLRFAGFRR